MLRQELAFQLRMRKSLRGIQDLDPEGISARLAEIDRAIAALSARAEAEEPATAPVRFDIVPIGAGVKAA
ncbi:MAG: hypothetical protein JWR08_1903 [Enterovirga sp.]|jgi:hypothetical protein|nr:hypothetical protein [Enterovirga sp.]